MALSAPARRRFLQIGGAGALAGVFGSALAGCGGGGGDDGAEPLPSALFTEERRLLTEPMLQNPTIEGVRVVWFSEVAEGRHRVRWGEELQFEVEAVTAPVERMLEDSGSQVFRRVTSTLALPEARPIYRHEARVSGLAPGRRHRYVAISEDGDGAWRSGEYSLQALPAPGQPVKLLLSSDQQNRAMSAANYQKAAETVGQLDAVLFAGDLVDFPNRASEWFDRANVVDRPAFFAALQGTVQRWNSGSVYQGGPVLQSAAMFPCLGNHEYNGRWRPEVNDINTMYNDPQPRWYAQARYEAQAKQINPAGDAALRARWITDNAYDWDIYRAFWSLPEGPEGKAYYAQRIGDVFLISLDVNRIWRGFGSGAAVRGKFVEPLATINDPDAWGFGDFFFRPFEQGSVQYRWLQDTLASEACRSARFRIVMAHQTMAGLGDNAVPVMAEIQVSIELQGPGETIGPFPFSEWPQRWADQVQPAVQAGRVRYVKYDYPLAGDLWRRDIEPLLQAGGVQLVHTGHSHVWNRTRAGSLNYIETSNVGNSFGAMFFDAQKADVSASQGPRWGGNVPGSAAWEAATAPNTALRWNAADYPQSGDPHDRPMALPTLANPMRLFEGAAQDLPFVASNFITTFSVFDSSSGLLSSYAFDTRDPAAEVLKFDELAL